MLPACLQKKELIQIHHKRVFAWLAPHTDSLVFSEPRVSDDRSQHGCEVAEAAEGVVDRRGQVLVPVQVGDEVEGQQRCEGAHKHEPWPD